MIPPNTVHYFGFKDIRLCCWFGYLLRFHIQVFPFRVVVMYPCTSFFFSVQIAFLTCKIGVQRFLASIYMAPNFLAYWSSWIRWTYPAAFKHFAMAVCVTPKCSLLLFGNNLHRVMPSVPHLEFFLPAGGCSSSSKSKSPLLNHANHFGTFSQLEPLAIAKSELKIRNLIFNIKIRINPKSRIKNWKF